MCVTKLELPRQLLAKPLLTPLSVVEPCVIDDLGDAPRSLVVVPYSLRCFNTVPLSPPSEATLAGEDDVSKCAYFSADDDSDSKCTCGSDNDLSEVPRESENVVLDETEYASGMLLLSALSR